MTTWSFPLPRRQTLTFSSTYTPRYIQPDPTAADLLRVIIKLAVLTTTTRCCHSASRPWPGNSVPWLTARNACPAVEDSGGHREAPERSAHPEVPGPCQGRDWSAHSRIVLCCLFVALHRVTLLRTWVAATCRQARHGWSQLSCMHAGERHPCRAQLVVSAASSSARNWHGQQRAGVHVYNVSSRPSLLSAATCTTIDFSSRTVLLSLWCRLPLDKWKTSRNHW
jgi:hypothetical protein